MHLLFQNLKTSRGKLQWNSPPDTGLKEAVVRAEGEGLEHVLEVEEAGEVALEVELSEVHDPFASWLQQLHGPGLPVLFSPVFLFLFLPFRWLLAPFSRPRQFGLPGPSSCHWRI